MLHELEPGFRIPTEEKCKDWIEKKIKRGNNIDQITGSKKIDDPNTPINTLYF